MQFVLALLVDTDIVVVDVFVNLSDDELNRLERKTDRPKEAFVSKLAVISFTECDAGIDDWSDSELMPRLALVVSLVEEHDEEEMPDDGGILSMLALILFAVIEEGVDESAAAAMDDMEVLTTLDEAAEVTVATEASAALRAARIFFRL